MVAMIQGGVSNVIYGKIGSHCVSDEDWSATQLMADNCGIRLIEYPILADNQMKPPRALQITSEYLKLKGWT